MYKHIDDCPVIYALSIVNGKWKLPIVWLLNLHGSIRFNELQRKLKGISNLMLSKSLHELEDAKMVNRLQYNEIPPRVEYSLTDLGSSICPALSLLGEWGEVSKREQSKINTD